MSVCRGKRDRDAVAASFWASVARGADGDCWEWQRSRDPRGYGRLSVRGTWVLAHRLAWELAVGRAVPFGLLIRHRCDNPPCCNPAHLLLGTHVENYADSVERGRRNVRGGAAVWCAKLNDASALAVFHAVGSHREIAERFGVSKGIVKGVKYRRTWKHIHWK